MSAKLTFNDTRGAQAAGGTETGRLSPAVPRDVPDLGAPWHWDSWMGSAASWASSWPVGSSRIGHHMFVYSFLFYYYYFSPSFFPIKLSLSQHIGQKE